VKDRENREAREATKSKTVTKHDKSVLQDKVGSIQHSFWGSGAFCILIIAAVVFRPSCMTYMYVFGFGSILHKHT
jgi:hypothetical protein